MKPSMFSKSLHYAAALGATALMVGLPISASAVTVSGSINESSLTTTTARPTLSGTATGTKTVRLTIRKEGSTKRIYTNKAIKVKDGKWKAKINKKLSDGTYDIELSSSKKTKTRMLDDEDLVVDTDNRDDKGDTKSDTTLAVSLVPLLAGGTTRAGASVSIAYLQVTNLGKESADVQGFWVKQNGSASAQSVVGLTIVDDKETARGATTGSTPFKNGSAFVPITIALAPGQMRLFTIKAIVNGDVMANIGKQLKIDVTGVETNASTKATFPIRGTTWTIGY